MGPVKEDWKQLELPAAPASVLCGLLQNQHPLRDGNSLRTGLVIREFASIWEIYLKQTLQETTDEAGLISLVP